MAAPTKEKVAEIKKLAESVQQKKGGREVREIAKQIERQAKELPRK